jgi:hypothetical protein
MEAAMQSVRPSLSDEQFVELHSYFAMAAHRMRNV